MEPSHSKDQNTFPCECGKGQVVLRTSHSKENFGRFYYSCPAAKPKAKDFGCGFFRWATKPQEISSLPPSPGSSSSGLEANCINCKLLETKIKMLEAELLARGHDNSSQSAAAIQKVSAQLNGLLVVDE